MLLKLLALLLGKTIINLARLYGSGGTAAPGLLAERISPNLLKDLSSHLKLGSVVISGTNGKTTTSRILSSIAREAQIKTIFNKEGSNLIRGLVSTVVKSSSWKGSLKADLGIFEVDEGTIPSALEQLKPRIVVLNNLFRDQLDRYGEIDRIRRVWLEALKKLPKDTIIVLNADDPSIAHLGHQLKNRITYYGLELKKEVFSEPYHAVDINRCLSCNDPLDYSYYYLSHLGEYKCPSCGFGRPKPSIYATSVHSRGIEGSKIVINLDNKEFSASVPSAGMYNVYNTLAAVAAANSLGIEEKHIAAGIKNFQGAFGRLERIPVENKNIVLALAKNPVGFNEVLKIVFQSKQQRNVLIALNDLTADGKDVSWIWDVDFEQMKGKISNLFIAGTRAEDLALRLNYADLGLREGKVRTIKDLPEAIEESLDFIPKESTLYVLPTYTAMLESRKHLVKKGVARHFLEEI